MEVFKLKKTFVDLAVSYDRQFKENDMRPYLVIVVEHSGKKYALAMTSKKPKMFYFKLKENSWILFSKAFEIVNDSILEGKYYFKSDSTDIPKLISENRDHISRAFNTYMDKHPTSFSPNNQLMKTIQNENNF